MDLLLMPIQNYMNDFGVSLYTNERPQDVTQLK